MILSLLQTLLVVVVAPCYIVSTYQIVIGCTLWTCLSSLATGNHWQLVLLNLNYCHSVSHRSRYHSPGNNDNDNTSDWMSLISLSNYIYIYIHLFFLSTHEITYWYHYHSLFLQVSSNQLDIDLLLDVRQAADCLPVTTVRNWQNGGHCLLRDKAIVSWQPNGSIWPPIGGMTSYMN